MGQGLPLSCELVFGEVLLGDSVNSGVDNICVSVDRDGKSGEWYFPKVLLERLDGLRVRHLVWEKVEKTADGCDTVPREVGGLGLENSVWSVVILDTKCINVIKDITTGDLLG